MLVFITVLSLIAALSMSVVAWRLAREERRRSHARVAALATAIQRGVVPDLPLRTGIVAPSLTPAADTATRSRLAAVMAIGVFVVGSAAALAVVLSGPSSTSRVTASSGEVAVPRPLELVALTHERDGDTLTIHGVVRNPAGAPEVDRVTAVVFLFGGNGAFTTSARGPVERTTLRGGTESPFTITVPGAIDVARYRVSFRTERAVLPHVDRRTSAIQGRP